MPACVEQVSSLQSQLTSLKGTSESQNKRAEDLNYQLKQVELLLPFVFHMSASHTFLFLFLSAECAECVRRVNDAMVLQHQQIE